MNEEIRADRRSFQRAYLVGIQFSRTPASEVEDHLAELEALVTTLGVAVVGTEIVRLQKPSPKYLVGDGKAEEIKTRVEMLDCDLLVFDDDLAPPQQHAWETRTQRAVIDRRKVIIDIFAQRARSREARLQIDLASLEYTLPRLKRAWTHLERQRGGGAFVGGAGEAQIETDRRLVRDRIARLREQLVHVRAQRDNQRKNREKTGTPTVALVGYTNTGKSSLMNRLTRAGVLQEDKLFATLDPTTRRLALPNRSTVLLTDTVGFIRKLPTTLVEAFKSTLEEAVLADLLLHVVDASHPNAREQYDTTTSILEELGAGDKPAIVVLNKMDAVEDAAAIRREFDDCPHPVVCTSVVSGTGLEELLHLIGMHPLEGREDLHLRIPASRFDIVSALHRDGEVLEERYDHADVLMHVLYPARLGARVREFLTTPW